MPNLNLNEDPRRRLRQQPLSPFKKPPITGGGSYVLPLMVLFGLIIFVGVVLYILNQSGYIYLWGDKTKQTNVTVLEQQPENVIKPNENVIEEKQPESVKDKEKVSQVNELQDSKGQKAKEIPKEKTSVETKKPVEKKPMPNIVPSGKKDLTGRYSIFIGSFRDRKKAEAEAQRWSEAGFEVAVSEKSFNSGKWYRVHIGNFSDREEARKIALKLADGFEGGYWIDVVK